MKHEQTSRANVDQACWRVGKRKEESPAGGRATRLRINLAPKALRAKRVFVCVCAVEQYSPLPAGRGEREETGQGSGGGQKEAAEEQKYTPAQPLLQV